jgi:hypothetical protein
MQSHNPKHILQHNIMGILAFSMIYDFLRYVHGWSEDFGAMMSPSTLLII